MAPNTNSSGDVCVEDARSSLSLDSYDVFSPRNANSSKHNPEDVVIFFDWGKRPSSPLTAISFRIAHVLARQ
ncbi:hypothetical protein DVH05_010161 [Phytophthora capsici]|nr:hypothetical protein DVH05_010161 [Phytophthora capsici]